MEDLNELYKLLERADTAGDDESVATLIPYIKQVEAAAASQSAEKEPVDVTQPPQDLTKPPEVKPAIQPPKEPSNIARRVAGDTALGLGQGVIEGAKAFIGLADIPTMGYAGKAHDYLAKKIYGGTLSDAENYLQSLKTPEQQIAEQKVEQAKGFMPTVKELAKNPSALLNVLEQSIPSMMGGVGIASKVQKGAKLLEANAPRIAKYMQAGAPAIGEMAISGGQTAESVREQMPEGTLTPAQSGIAAASGIATGVLSVLGSKVAHILGVENLETYLLKKVTGKAAEAEKRNALAVAVKTAVNESVVEELPQSMQEQIAQNIMLGQPWDQGVAEAGATGLLTGAAMSGPLVGINQAMTNKELDRRAKMTPEDLATEEKRASRDTLIKETLKDLEEKANQVNQAKADAEAQLKAAQNKQVVSEATDLESMAPVNPTALTETTLTSWGLSKNSKAYKTLIGQDAGTPEGRALIDTALESHMGKINEPAVETYKSLIDQQKVEADNGTRTDAGPGIDTGTIRIDNEVPGQPKYGTPGTVAGYNEPTINISGTPTTLPKTGEADVNAPLKDENGFITNPEGQRYIVFQHKKGSNFLHPQQDIGAFAVVNKGKDGIPDLNLVLNKEGKLVTADQVLTNNESNGTAFIPQSEEQAAIIMALLEQRATTTVGSNERKAIDAQLVKVVKGEETKTPVKEAPVEEAPVSTQPKLASQLRALDPTNSMIDALQYDQASEEEVAVAQNTVKELQASRKSKRADLTKVSEEEKDLPLEARGEIQNTGETPDSIEGAFQQQYGKNVGLAKKRGLLNFLNDVSELPPEVGPVTPGTKAVYHKGKGYFITNRITKEDAPRMLLHEIGVHYGLEGMLGTNNYKRIVKQIKQNHLTDKELKASWDNTLKTYPELTENSDNFMQEVIANIGETAPNNSIFRQIVGYIKQFLSKLGYGWDINKITADDIRDMVQQSVRMSLAGKIKSAQPDTTLAGTDTKPTFFSQLKKELLAHPEKLKVMPAEQWRLWLNKRSKRTIKAEEIEYSKIKEFLDSKQPKDSVSRDELVKFVEEKLPKVETVQLGGNLSKKSNEELNAAALKRQIGTDNFHVAYNKLRQKLIELVPNARYKDLVTELPEDWTVRKNDEDNEYEVLDSDGFVQTSGSTEQEAITWAIHDVLNSRRRRRGEEQWVGPEDGVDIEQLVEFIRQDANDVAEIDNPEDTPFYAERMEALNIANQFAPLELDEFWGQNNAMRRSQEDFNRAMENETPDDARFTNFALPGERRDAFNLSLVFDPKGELFYMAPQVHSMGPKADKNRIVHVLGNIRTNINGDRVLFIEEIQSDWGQEAYDLRQEAIERHKTLGFTAEEAKIAISPDYGFKKELTPEEKNKLKSLLVTLDTMDEELSNLDNYLDRLVAGREAIIEANKGKPKTKEYTERLIASVQVAEKSYKKRKELKEEFQALKAQARELQSREEDKVNKGPYVADTKAWVTLALKQIFRYAADQGLDTVMFTNGQQVADRYRLSQVVNNIKWNYLGEDTYSVEAFKDGKKVWSNYHTSPKEIVDNLGQPVLNEIRLKQYKLKDDPIRKRLSELKDKHMSLRWDIQQSKKDIVLHATNNGWSNQDIDSLLDAIAPLSEEDQKGYLVDNLLGAGVVNQTFGKQAINYFINTQKEYEKVYNKYNKEMKLHGLEDFSSPIASSIDVPEMEINNEGKGMKEFYDNIMPQALRDYLKKIGGAEIFKTSLLDYEFDGNYVPQKQLQVILSPKAFETVSGPQPLFARMSEEELDRQLAAAGNKRAQKVQPPSFKDNLMAHPLQTVGDMVRSFRKAAFSFDHAINQKIMAAMRKAGVSVEEIAKSFYQMQISQAVKSDQMADLFMIHGNLSYDPNSFKFVVSDVKDSMTSIRDKLTALAKKHNFPEYKMYEAASSAFIARRSKGLIPANKSLKQRVLKLMIAGKTAQARTQMERNYKLVHLTAAEIKEGEKFFTDFKDSNGKSELEKIFKSWNKNRARVLNFAKDQGLYSEEDIDDLLDVMDYVPFFRDAQIEAGKATKEYPRGLLDAAADKRLKGSYQPVNNVFDNMERWTRYVIRKSVNNRAAQEKIRLYSQWIPDDIKILRGKERSKAGNVVNVWQNGKLVKYDFQGTDGESMVDGFTGLEPVMIPFLNGKLRPFSNFLRLNIVLQPVFSIAQIPMDIYNAMFTSQVRHPLAVPLQAIKEIMLTPFGMSAARNYLKTTGTVGKHDFSSEYERIDIDAMHELKKAGSLTKLLKLIAHPLGVLAMASDNVIRQAVYSQVMLETKDQARAVHMAEEIINFRRTGSSGIVNIMRQNAPFVNANLQSIHIAFSTLLDSGIGPDAHGKAFKRLVTTGAQMFILAMIYAVLNADDDDYKKADPLEKDRYLFIPGSNGFKLPLRNDIITLLFKTLPEHLVNRFIKESEDSTKMLHALKVGLGRALTLPSGIPTLISPMIESAYNIDSNTGRPIIGKGQENLEEDLQYSNKYTMQLSRMMGDASGTSPAMIQHFFDRYFGTTSLLLGMVTNGLVANMRDEILPEKTVRDYLLQLPSMSSFVVKEHGARNINDYYELNDIVTKIVTSAKRYEKLDYKKYQEYLAKDNHAEIINMQKEMAAISKELQVLRNYENQIYASKDATRWTPATKKAELERLEGIRQNMLGSQLKLKERSDRYIQQLRYRGGL